MIQAIACSVDPEQGTCSTTDPHDLEWKEMGAHGAEDGKDTVHPS